MYTFTFITLMASMLLNASANPMPSRLIRRDPVDCSPHLLSPQEGYYTNCIQKEGHYMNADGTCPPGTADTGCKSYCEVKRKASLAKSSTVQGTLALAILQTLTSDWSSPSQSLSPRTSKLASLQST